jgi:hypothetical protein
LRYLKQTILDLREIKMLIYPIDLEQPYRILKFNNDGTYTVSGFAKILQCHVSEETLEFGGHPCIFTLHKHDFLTKAQKSQLRWVKKHLGDKQHDKLKDEIYDSVIAGHTYNDT